MPSRQPCNTCRSTDPYHMNHLITSKRCDTIKEDISVHLITPSVPAAIKRTVGLDSQVISRAEIIAHLLFNQRGRVSNIKDVDVDVVAGARFGINRGGIDSARKIIIMRKL